MLRSIEKIVPPVARNRSSSPHAKKNFPSQKVSGPRSCAVSTTLELLFLFSKKCLLLSFPPVPLVFSPRADKRHAINTALEARRARVLPTPASAMLASVRLSAHSQLEPHCCLCSACSRKTAPATPSHSSAIVAYIYKDEAHYHRDQTLLLIRNSNKLCRISF